MFFKIIISLVLLVAVSCTDSTSGDPSAEALAAGSGSTFANAAVTATSMNTAVELTESTITQILKVKPEVSEIKVYEVPDLNADVTFTFPSLRVVPGQDSGEPTTPSVFTVVKNPNTPVGWWNVNLPVKPNGTTGWVRVDDVSLETTDLKIMIDRDNFNLKVARGEEIIIESAVAIGTGDSATPVGEFFITELIDSTNPFYGPFAYGLSGFSEQLEEFGGNDAIIGIHGTNDPSSIGREASQGCVRLPNEVIEELTRILPLGTPVEII